MSRTTRLLLVCCALVSSVPTRADDFLGIYVGAGVGRTALQQDYYQIDAHATGWKVFAGWRPISLLGVEAEYVDLGNKGMNTYQDTVHVSTSSNAAAAYVLGYLPVPLPWIDLYGKVGVAHVKANSDAYSTVCQPPTLCIAPTPPASDDSSKTSVAWGAGLQFKLDRWAARVDYERFDGSQGNPSLLAAEILFNF